jgi:hypothetical protein
MNGRFAACIHFFAQLSNVHKEWQSTKVVAERMATSIVKDMTKIFLAEDAILEAEVFSSDQGSFLSELILTACPRLEEAITPIKQCLVKFCCNTGAELVARVSVDGQVEHPTAVETSCRTPAFSRANAAAAASAQEAMSGLEVERLASAQQSAQLIGDLLVSRQVAFISAWSSTVDIGCILRQWSLKHIGNRAYVARQIQTEVVELLKTARSCRQSVIVHEAGAKVVLTSVEKTVHVSQLDALVDIPQLAASALSELDGVVDELAASFTKDAEDLMRLAGSKYPAWRDKKESLLDDVQLCGELLKTSEETYLQLGPMAKELRRIADQIEAVNTDKRQPLFAPSLNLKAVRKCADQVVETVTVIFVLSFLQNEMCTLRNQMLRSDAAKLVKSRASEKMILSDQLLAVIDEYEQGTRTAELFPELTDSSRGTAQAPRPADGKDAKGDAPPEGGKGKGKPEGETGGKGKGKAQQGKGDGKKQQEAPAEPQQEAPAEPRKAARAPAKRARLTGMFGT